MLYGLFELPWWGYVLATLGMTHVTIAGVTIFLHRHQAHRALDLGPIPSHFFRFWLWLSTGMNTKEWAAIHRKHHAKCETAEDPHSPQIHGIKKVLWGGVFLYVKESRNRETLEKYGTGTPDDWIERKLYTPHHKLGVGIMFLLDLLLFGIVAGPLIWLVQMLWIPFWAAGVINGLGHFWGYRNFACADASTNLLPWGILIGGEELHNNHHTFATSAKLSNKWYEFDIGWMYIRILEMLGQARVKKVAPRPRLGSMRPAVDQATLNAVIANRYDVLARYLKSLRQVAHEELQHLREEAQRHAVLKRLTGDLQDGACAHTEAVLAQSERLSKLVEMRRELEAIWARSSATHEQLLKQLQDWIHNAEQSGVRQLQEFSIRLRSYKVAA
ncbi:MAG TPA: fatty acid desaturase [Rhodocyclaceae bacterium]|nr:fatty acid desaturase [Rhodocyclaceae bacterium]